MENSHDTVVYIVVPNSNEQSQLNVGQPILSGEFRSKAASTLKGIFNGTYWTLKESNGPQGLELKSSVRTDTLSSFRKKLAELGFLERSANHSNGLDNKMERED